MRVCLPNATLQIKVCVTNEQLRYPPTHFFIFSITFVVTLGMIKNAVKESTWGRRVIGDKWGGGAVPSPRQKETQPLLLLNSHKKEFSVLIRSPSHTTGMGRSDTCVWGPWRARHEPLLAGSFFPSGSSWTSYHMSRERLLVPSQQSSMHSLAHCVFFWSKHLTNHKHFSMSRVRQGFHERLSAVPHYKPLVRPCQLKLSFGDWQSQRKQTGYKKRFIAAPCYGPNIVCNNISRRSDAFHLGKETPKREWIMYERAKETLEGMFRSYRT